MLRSAITRMVDGCTRHPWPVILIVMALSLASGLYAGTNWKINTNTMRILPDNLPWRRSEIAYQHEFPQHAILAVVRAPTPEMTELAGATLANALQARRDQFHAVLRPKGGEFLRRASLLFLPLDQLEKTTRQLAAARPLLGELAADPTLRGAAGALIFGEQAVAGGHAQADALAGPMTDLSDMLDRVFAHQFASFSWRGLMGSSEGADGLQDFIEIDPVLNYSALQPGKAATDAIREASDRTQLAKRFGASLQLTGTAPINDQQFSTLQKSTGWSTAGTAVAVLVILWLALRSVRIIAAVALALLAGFAITAALGLLMVGSFNLISIAFAVLFVGLGADFGIQFTVRYRSERHRVDALRPALRDAADRAGIPLALATVSTAAGFLSFLPTAYLGMAELGQIAGVGMVVALLVTLTLLPALLAVFNPPGEPVRLGFRLFAPADRFLQRHRIGVVVGTIAVVLLASPLLIWLRFDFDPTHLQPPDAPAVRAYHALASNPQAGIQAINIAAPSLQDARALARRLGDLQQVRQTRTIDVLVPTDQDRKMALIARAAAALDPALDPKQTRPAPSDADDVAAIRRAADGLAPLTHAGGRAQAAAVRLRPLLLRLANGAVELRQSASNALVIPLQDDLRLIRDMLHPEAVTLDTLPKPLAREWLAPDGKARVEVLPKGNANNDTTLRQFAQAVLAVAPDAAGSPVSLLGSQRTVVHAFIEAGAWAVLAIAVILWATLRRFGDVLLTLVPLLVAGLVTLELIALIGQPLNFANIIALPLLLGVGVAFKIYYITAWRAGATDLLETALTRAILFSAMTTATAFGSLWLSPQPGLSSMGKLMALALLCTLAAAVLFQPALMGPPRQKDRPRQADA